MDLITFLRDRLDEDEQTARIGAQLHEDEPADPSYKGGIADLEAAGWEPGAARRFSTYVARFDPARMVREAKAKRQVIEHNTRLHQMADPATHPGQEYVLAAGASDYVLRLLALPYADHIDYREEWRP